MTRDLLPAAEARRDRVMTDCGGNKDAAILLLALLLEAALVNTSSGMLRQPPERNR